MQAVLVGKSSCQAAKEKIIQGLVPHGNKPVSMSVIFSKVMDMGYSKSDVEQAIKELLDEGVIGFGNKDYTLINGLKLFMHPQGYDESICDEFRKGKLYEPYETECFDNLIRCGDVVVDVGANIGYYSLLFASRAGKLGKVYCFEPEPTNFFMLQKTIAVNNLSQMRAYCCAAGDKQQTLRLYKSKHNAGDHRAWDCGEKRDSIDIQCVILDDFLSDVEQVHFFKTDTQGQEVQVIRGASKLLKRSPNVMMAVEFWPLGYNGSGSSTKEFASLIKDLGFTRIYIIDEIDKKLVDVSMGLLDIGSSNPDWMVNILCMKR